MADSISKDRRTCTALYKEPFVFVFTFMKRIAYWKFVKQHKRSLYSQINLNERDSS